MIGQFLVPEILILQGWVPDFLKVSLEQKG